MLGRDAALAACIDVARRRGAAIFVGNGNNARAVAALNDGADVFHMVGSMGLVAPLAAGFAAVSGRCALAIEGDGNALMGLSGQPTVAAATHGCFAHVVLDNGQYETTGGQVSLASRVDFPSLARAAGYRSAASADSPESLADRVGEMLAGSGPGLVHAPTSLSGEPQHPRVPWAPGEISERFEAWVRSSQ